MAQFVRCNFRGQGYVGPCRTQRGGRLAAAAEQAVHVDRGATADLQVAEVEVVRLAAHGPLVEEQRDVLAAARVRQLLRLDRALGERVVEGGVVLSQPSLD